MTVFVVNAFSGMSPNVTPRKLGANFGQKVVNANLTSGDALPMKSPLKIGNNLLSKAGVKLSIYRFGQDLLDNQYWFHWLNHVDVVRGNIADDTAEKTYFTGDGVPKYTYSPNAVTGAGTQYPYASFNLGVIKPDLITLNTSVSNRVITSITKLGTLATVITTLPHKLITGGDVLISGASDALYNGKKTATVVNANTFTCPLASEPAANATGTLTFNYGGLPESRVYAFSYVDNNGAEGAPAITSGILTVTLGQIVTFTGIPTAPSGNYNYVKKRIYRTAEGSQQSTLRFVGEISLATTTFTDDKTGTELSESIPSLTYEIPPADMKGLISFSNGMMAGISGNQVCISVPYQPHAWPISSRYSFVGLKPVALGSFGQSIAVLTKGEPSILSGSSPESMSQTEVKNGAPCLSAQSVVELSGGVLWASDEGLSLLSNGGYDLITKQRFTAREWEEYNPSSIHAYRWESRYVGFYTKTNGTTGGFVFDLQTGDFYELGFYATAGFTDPKNGNLYLAIGNDVYLFDGGTALQMTWKSKVFTTPKPINMAYGKVVAEKYPVMFTLWANGQVKFLKSVSSVKSFALPRGYKADEFEMQVQSYSRIKGMAISESIYEIQGGIE